MPEEGGKQQIKQARNVGKELTVVTKKFQADLGKAIQLTMKDLSKNIVKTVKDAVKAVKDWLGKLFNFDSGTDVIKSAFNLLTFFPNIIKDAVLSVSAWLLDLFGFGEAAKTVANAKEFSLGDMLFNAVESIWEWFKGLLDIDVMSIVKSIPGGETLMALFGAGESSKAKDELASLGIKQAGSDWGDWDIMDQEKQIRAAAKTMSMKEISYAEPCRCISN